MRARLFVFPVKGRNWCFSRSIDPLSSETLPSGTPSTLKQLWQHISSSRLTNSSNVELLVDFISLKMNGVWMGLEKAPKGTLKNKIHGLGLKLLARVEPSEIFLKSISKEGNEKLLQLVSDHSQTQSTASSNEKTSEAKHKKSDNENSSLLSSTWVLQASPELEELLCRGCKNDGLSESAISDICNTF